MTRTCDSTNHINQLRLATQFASHQRPCIATNVPDHLPIQLLPIANPRPSFRTNQFHIDIKKQKCWRNTHVSLPCSFSPTTHQLWIELNAEIPENPHSNNRWKPNAHVETALAWSEHTNQKILRKILGFLNKGKLAVVKPRWQFTSWTFRRFVCFPIQPLCFRWSDERITKTDADVKTEMNVDFHIQKGKSHCTLIHPCRVWRNGMTSSTRRLHSFSTETRWRKFGPPTDNGNWTFALDLVQESLQLWRETMSPKKSRRQSSHGTGFELSVTADVTTLLQRLENWASSCSTSCWQPDGSMLEIFHSTKCFNHFDVCWCGLDRPDLIEGKMRKPSRNWRGLFRFVSLWIPTW